MNKFKSKVQHNNNNGVPGAAGGPESSFPAIRPRHTQGREKRRPNDKMLWGKNLFGFCIRKYKITIFLPPEAE